MAAGDALGVLAGEQGQGVVLHGAVAAGAVQPGGLVGVAQGPGGALGVGGVAGGAGLGPPAGQVHGVQPVHGRREVQGAAAALGRVVVAGAAVHGFGLGGEAGAAHAVVGGEHILGRGRGDAGHAVGTRFRRGTACSPVPWTRAGPRVSRPAGRRRRPWPGR